MLSPFPGMNPYFEQPDVWPGFHAQFIPAVAQTLNARLADSYIALVEEQVYVQEVDDGEAGQLAGRADVAVARRAARGAAAAAAVLDAPVRVIVPAADEETLARVEIRSRRDKEIVTVIELLSPTNKRPGPSRDQYLAKRATVLHSDAHFIEIDLLRGWERAPIGDAVDSAYRVLLSRAEERPSAGMWPIGLRERLPIIPVPLRGPDADVEVDLQALLHQVYDAGAYRRLIYEGEPVPPLSPVDSAWGAEIAKQHRID